MLSLDQYLKAFKAYDIRGLYKDEVDEYSAYVMGRAMGKYILDQFGESGSLLFGSDSRYPNNTLISYFLHGVHEVGFANVYGAMFEPALRNPHKDNQWGLCSSQYMYAITEGDFSIGVTFTASHNPKEYVGMKFFDTDVVFVDTQLLRQLFVDEFAQVDASMFPSEPEAYIEYSSRIEEKKNELHERLATKWAELEKQYNFVVDFCHGAGVTCEREFLAEYAAKTHTVKFLHDHPDGTFPVHDSETQNRANYQWLVDDIKANGRDFGVMFDGDVDRLGIVTNTGNVIPGDFLTAAMTKVILEEKHQEKDPLVLYDVMSSGMIEDVAKAAGGEAQPTTMGRYFINREMLEKNSVFAGECSGHFMFGAYGSYELPLLAVYYVCKAAEAYGSMEELYQAYNSYHKSPVMDAAVVDKDATLEKVRTHFADYQPLAIDGVNVFADEFRMTIRKSNTSDKVRYSVEAKDKAIFDRVMKDMEELVNE